jgi:hypothetical protein
LVFLEFEEGEEGPSEIDLSHYINLSIAEHHLAQYMDFEDDELEHNNGKLSQSCQGASDVAEPLVEAKKIAFNWLTKFKFWTNSSKPPRRTWEDKGKWRMSPVEGLQEKNRPCSTTRKSIGKFFGRLKRQLLFSKKV